MTLASLYDSTPPIGPLPGPTMALVILILVPVASTVAVVMVASQLAARSKSSQVTAAESAGMIVLGVLASMTALLGQWLVVPDMIRDRPSSAAARIPEQVTVMLAALPLAAAVLFAIMLAIVSRRTADVERGEAVRRPL